MSLDYHRSVSFEHFISGDYKRDIKAAIKTSCPCVVDSFNPEEKTISAHLPFVRHYAQDDGTTQERGYPVYDDVPILYPILGAGWIMTFPLKKGDIGVLEFSFVPLDEWWAGDGGLKADILPQMFGNHLGDCFFKPGAQTVKNNIGTASATDVVLEHVDGKTKLILKPDGTVTQVCNRLNIGAEDAAKALARSDKTDEFLGDLATGLNEARVILALPPVVLTGSVASGKVFTND